MAKNFAQSKRHRDEFLEAVRRIPGVPDDGPLAFHLPPDIFPFLKRLTKGMLAYFYPEYDYSRDEFETFPYTGTDGQMDSLWMLQNVGRHISRGHEEFDTMHLVANDNSEAALQHGIRGMWSFTFYGAVTFIICQGWVGGAGRKADEGAGS